MNGTLLKKCAPRLVPHKRNQTPAPTPQRGVSSLKQSCQHPRKTPGLTDPSPVTRHVTYSHLAASLLDGDDDLKTWNAAVPFLPPTDAALLLFLFPTYCLLIYSRYPDPRSSQTSPRQSKFTRHCPPVRPQRQRHRTPHQDRPPPPKDRPTSRKGRMEERLGISVSEDGATRYG